MNKVAKITLAFWILKIIATTMGETFDDYFCKLLIWVIKFHKTIWFGATFGDFLTKPLAKGGLDLGTLNASVVCGILLFFIITISNRKVKLEK